MKNFMKLNFNITKILIACDVFKSAQNFHKNRASHGLVFLLSKHKYSFSDGTVLEPDKNEILYLPKNSTYSVSSSDGGCFAINFEFSNDTTFPPFVFKVKNQSILEHFKIARNAWSKKLQGYELKCKAELYNIIYTLQQEYTTTYVSKDKYNLIYPAVEYIHENYTNQLISVEKLSKICKITPEYFRKIFRYFFGTSPINYINNLKIEHAKELLSSGLYSVSEASLASGFSDPSHFSRVFKKATEKSPSQY
ncbi:MAG: helix-turn-helix transcriptional regulator [Clostridiales bacterium]|nr:helix-turn-helix transcriptional regulator [Clostridiales bacterium]